MGKFVKYMGSAHVAELLAGDNFGGQLSEPLTARVEFSSINNWVVDAAKAGLSDAAVDVLVLSPDFMDVSGMERVPLNRHQTTFLGMKDGDSVPAVEAVADEEDLQYAAPEGEPAGETVEAPSAPDEVPIKKIK